jgi:peptide chain release factor
MTPAQRETWCQITAGKGPAECAWAVTKVLEVFLAEAREAGIEAKTIELEPGPEDGTCQSALVALCGGPKLAAFVNGWRGTVQWIARSPFRPEHRRRNWFAGIDELKPVEESRFDANDVRWETMRASGPGGQHVNRTESAVRVTHLPTGIQATAAEERSQHRNRKLALARLARKIADREAAQRGEAREKRWRAHQELERGNPVRVFRDSA